MSSVNENILSQLQTIIATALTTNNAQNTPIIVINLVMGNVSNASANGNSVIVSGENDATNIDIL